MFFRFLEKRRVNSFIDAFFANFAFKLSSPQNLAHKISVDKQSHHKILDEWAEKEWGEKENKTPAPQQSESGKGINANDNYTTNSQILGGNNQNLAHKTYYPPRPKN